MPFNPAQNHKIDKLDYNPAGFIVEFRGPYRFLSNFFPCDVEYEGLTYPSSEHAFQAAKSTNKVYRREMQGCLDGATAKAKGRSVAMRPGWSQMRVGVMFEIVWNKFHSNLTLRSDLIRTGNMTLIEGNDWNDQFWGVSRNIGQNWLGNILMNVRFRLAHGLAIDIPLADADLRKLGLLLYPLPPTRIATEIRKAQPPDLKT